MSDKCGQPAVAVYIWPTMQLLPVCDHHETKLLNIAKALGCRVGALPVTPGATCTQHVTAKESKQ